VSRFGRLINAGFGRCKHRVLGTCVDAADGCCAGVACAICVKLLDSYGEVVDGASFAWDGTGYSGSVGGFSFESYWLDNYGDCEFHVIITAGGYIEPIHIIKTKGEPSPVGHNQGCSPSPGPVVSNDPDEACCMNPEGETEVDDGDNTYTMTWGPVDPLILARRPVITSACAQIDIAIVVDDTSSMASVISSLQTEIGNLVTAVDAISDSFQFSLITFKDTTTQTVSFSINNAAAINAAVAAMTTGMGNQIPEASDIALNEAVVQSGWRAAAQKVIVLITDAPPGGLDDVADPADVTNLNAGGTAAGVADQYMYCIGVGTNAAMISAMTSTAAAAVATGGGGKYETLTPGNIVTNVIALIDALCPPVTCHERFCGDCDCAPRQLCLQVSSDGCSVTNIISLAENYADPDCPLPVWDLDFTCGYFSFEGQLALVRDEYTGDCILRMSGTRGGAVDEESQDFAITDCAALSAEFTLTEDYVDYLITISPADCDACEPDFFCCEIRQDTNVTLDGGWLSGGDPGCIATTITTAGLGSPRSVINPAVDVGPPQGEGYVHLINYIISPSPTCSETDIARQVAIYNQGSGGLYHPSIDPNIVGPCEWYLAVYSSDGQTLISIQLQYTQCCQDLILGPASSFLKTLFFPDVDFGGVLYDLTMTNHNTIAIHGPDC